MFGHWTGMGMGTTWGWVFGLVFMAGMVTVIILLVRLAGDGSRRTRREQGQASQPDGALAILDDRYARGEIDTAEYQERRRAIVSDDA